MYALDIKKQLNIPDEEMFGYVIGNKKDLTDERKINEESAKKIADTFNLKYIETSALSGENVDQAFTTLATLLYESRK